jgi:very-short-patch-repair endonuclease
MPNDWSLNHLTGGKPTTGPDVLVARLAAKQWGVLTVADLVACGLTRREVEVRVRQGHLHALHRGVYAVGHPNVCIEGHWLAAVKACGPAAVLSHFAAACLWGLLRWDGRRVDVTAPTKRRHQGVRAHRSEAIECVVQRGIPVTPRLRTVVDLARTEDEATVKRALRAARFSERELALLPAGGMLGRIVGLSAAATASHSEDYVLDLILKAGLSHPEVNRPQRVPGRLTVPDLRWPEQQLIVEVDSREWHSDPLAQRDDADRQARLEAEGWRVLRVTLAQARQHPQLTIARLRAAGVV